MPTVTPLASYLRNTLVRVGLAVLVLGMLPFVGVMGAATLGLTADPDPNPVVLGALAMLSFYVGVGLVAVGAVRHHLRHRDEHPRGV